jgi:hypothetical protein
MLGKDRAKKQGVVKRSKRGLQPEGSRATSVLMTKSNDTTICSTTLKTTLIHVGLDVHKETIAVALAQEGEEPHYLKTISHDLHAVEKLIHELALYFSANLDSLYHLLRHFHF